MALKGIISVSNRYKIFASDWLWIEVCQSIVLNKIDITMTTVNKIIGNWYKPNFAQSRPATKNPTLGTYKVWCLANNLLEKQKILYVWIKIKRKYISNFVFLIAVINYLIKKF